MRVKFYLLLFFLVSSIFADSEYQFGQGYNIKNTPLYLGGYFSARYDINDKKDEFDLDDVAVLLYGSFEKFDFLAEVEASDVTFEKEGKRDYDLANQDLHIERLFFTFDIKDEAHLSIGKFNTDIGFWNQTPINVLHDTTTPPHVMTNLFPKLTTGISYKDQTDDELSISLAIQHNGDLDDEYNNLFVKEHYTLSLKKDINDYIFGVGGGYFKEKNHKGSTYATLGVQKEFDYSTLLSEFYSRFSDDDLSIPYDFYIQNSWHIKDKHDIVARVEIYDDEIEDSSDSVGLVGYTYRPYPFMALKAEYEKHRIDRLSHAVFSFSVIF